MATLKHVFEGQLRHGIYLAALLAVAAWLSRDLVSAGAFVGISSRTWFWGAVGAAIAHQVWVLVCWRLELHGGLLTKWFGPAGFRLYAAGFAVCSFVRLGALVCLAVADRGSLPVAAPWLTVLATILVAPVGYLFYSVARCFTFRRALGADHFEARYRLIPIERRGIFRYVRNGMYTVGFLAVWLPGLYAASAAALLAAAFEHAYIWVHYYCTELPDMRRIYGEGV